LKQIILAVLTILIVTGCATRGMLPHNAKEANFDGSEGKTGWSQYKHIETFHGYDVNQVYEASKVGLGNAGFSLIEANKLKGVVIGEHGMTAHDWNIMAGVYFKKIDTGTQVMVIAEGSKDVGFSGDVTSDGWTGKILKGLREYLNSTYQSILKVDKKDIK